jgi:aspartyl-tRNA(Asn)/glutamyl-tRNA(Gln) amidotransferase subunit A
MDLTGRSIADLARALADGRTTSRALAEAALESIARDAAAFTRVNAERARAEADHADSTRKLGAASGALAGIPISVKDLFDVAGEPTPAGSAVLRDAPPPVSDAPTVARLRAAGAIVVGRTHMSEFAFTGLGLNPHGPTCTNAHDPARVPGGSSSGAAVSVARGQAAMGLGTDTGGSVRIPASFNGLVGFKPTQARITRDGAFPLSESLDSIGPLANTVACCALVDGILADQPRAAHPAMAAGLRLAVPTDFVLNDMDEAVAAAFERALAALSSAGSRIERIPIEALNRLPNLFAKGTIANAEAYAFHAGRNFFGHKEQYDPNVLTRIELGGRMSAADYIGLTKARVAMIAEVARLTAPYDALVLPTTPQLAPRIADVSDAARFSSANALALRNASAFNFLDHCAISLPMQRAGEMSCGLMLVGERMADAKLLAVAAAVEAALAKR